MEKSTEQGDMKTTKRPRDEPGHHGDVGTVRNRCSQRSTKIKVADLSASGRLSRKRRRNGIHLRSEIPVSSAMLNRNNEEISNGLLPPLTSSEWPAFHAVENSVCCQSHAFCKLWGMPRDKPTDDAQEVECLFLCSRLLFAGDVIAASHIYPVVFRHAISVTISDSHPFHEQFAREALLLGLDLFREGRQFGAISSEDTASFLYRCLRLFRKFMKSQSRLNQEIYADLILQACFASMLNQSVEQARAVFDELLASRTAATSVHCSNLLRTVRSLLLLEISVEKMLLQSR